jgi:hypothetical protein
VTVLNPTQTGVDRLGIPNNQWTPTTVTGCSVQEHRTDRTISLTDVSSARYRLFAPVGSPLNPDSLVGVNDPKLLGSVANQAAMLALTGAVGSWCIRLDLGVSFTLTAEPATSLSSWQKVPLYLMDGNPAVWQTASGRQDHIECYLKWQQG